MSRHGVELAAADLHVDQTSYVDCPYCERIGKMGVTRTHEGVLYHCFAAACGEKGFIPDAVGYQKKTRTYKPRERRYVGQVYDPSTEDLEAFAEVFGITDWGFQVTAHDEYLFPIRSADGFRVGEVIRQPTWAGFEHREGRPGRPKALTYLAQGVERISWHRRDGNAIVVVEDQVSAQRIAEHTGLDAVALLGNTLTLEAAQQIQRVNDRHLIWWLDPDMTSKSFLMNAEFGPLFRFSRVVFSDLDPKDTPLEDLPDLLFD